MLNLPHRTRSRVLFAAFVWTTSSSFIYADRLNRTEGARRPIAVIPLAHANRLAVLNRRSGTISTIDPIKQLVVAETKIGQRLSGGCVLGDDTIAVLDDSQDQLLRLSFSDDGQPRIVARLSVPSSPLDVVTIKKGTICAVASSWAHQVTLVDLSHPDRLVSQNTIDLTFAPDQMLAIGDDRLLVADAFGGWMAMIDVERGSIIRQRELNGTHNIAGIATDSDQTVAYVVHQILHDQSTTKSNVHWGDVMSNVVRRLDLEWFVSQQPEETTAADLYYLGHPDSAAGDPQGILITSANRFVVRLAGVQQVAISDRGLNHFQRLDVGRRPTAMCLDDAEDRLYVANHFDDSITVIDVRQRRIRSTFSLGPSGPSTLADKGEQLFYDARLSSDGWFSCHSCHTDGHTNGRRSDTLGDGYHGDPKLVISLLGVADTAPWAWNGNSRVLEQQIRKSIETTMRGDSPRIREVQALAAFLMSLSPPPSLAAARGHAGDASVQRGQVIFHEQGCVDCHQPPTYTSADVYDVGLQDKDGQQRFNPPSLLGVGHRHRLLHDGRADSIREALNVHPYEQPIQLPDADWIALESFLSSL